MSEPLDAPPSSLAYLRLHADSLFLSLLLVSTGCVNIIYADQRPISIMAGRVLLSMLTWSAMYIVGGVALTVAVAGKHIALELAARAIIVVSVIWSTVGIAAVLGPFSADAVARYAALAIVLLVCGMRASALIAKETVYLIYPGRSRPRSEQAGLVLHGSADPGERGSQPSDEAEDKE